MCDAHQVLPSASLPRSCAASAKTAAPCPSTRTCGVSPSSCCRYPPSPSVSPCAAPPHPSPPERPRQHLVVLVLFRRRRQDVVGGQSPARNGHEFNFALLLPRDISRIFSVHNSGAQHARVGAAAAALKHIFPNAFAATSSSRMLSASSAGCPSRAAPPPAA